MNQNCVFIILIILLLALTHTLSATTTETFTPTIKSGINRNKRRCRYILRDGFTQMKSFFS